jgi:hypothetical protein
MSCCLAIVAWIMMLCQFALFMSCIYVTIIIPIPLFSDPSTQIIIIIGIFSFMLGIHYCDLSLAYRKQYLTYIINGRSTDVANYRYLGHIYWRVFVGIFAFIVLCLSLSRVKYFIPLRADNCDVYSEVIVACDFMRTLCVIAIMGLICVIIGAIYIGCTYLCKRYETSNNDHRYFASPVIKRPIWSGATPQSLSWSTAVVQPPLHRSYLPHTSH